MITKYENFITEGKTKVLEKPIKSVSEKVLLEDKYHEFDDNFDALISFLNDTYSGKSIRCQSTCGWEELVALNVEKFSINTIRDFSINVSAQDIYVGRKKLENDNTYINLKDIISEIIESDDVRRYTEEDPYGEEEWEDD